MELRPVVENLYAVFRRYPLNPQMEGSPMYADLALWNQALATKPLRALTEDDLRIFYFKAMTTWGNVNDFKYFLPRILELLTEYLLEWETWVALDKLNYGHWQTWPGEEQAIIRHYLLALWQEILANDTDAAACAFHDYFPAIAHLYPDFEAMLRLWAASTAESAMHHLVDFVYYEFESLLEKQVLPGFYASESKGKTFYQWLTTDAMTSKLEDAFFRYGTCDFADKLSFVLQLIERSRK